MVLTALSVHRVASGVSAWWFSRAHRRSASGLGTTMATSMECSESPYTKICCTKPPSVHTSTFSAATYSPWLSLNMFFLRSTILR